MSNWQNRILGYEEVDPHTLNFNPNNYKEHPESQSEMMGGILGEVGWIQTVIVNKRTGNLIDGHMRVQMALDSKEPTVPVIFVDLDEEEELKALASFDPIATFAKSERDKLTSILNSVNIKNASMRDLVEKIAKKNRLEMEDDGDAGDEQEDDAPSEPQDEFAEVIAKWGVEPGQLWTIPSINTAGKSHRLLCGDSSDPVAVERLMRKDKAVLMVTDPPYGINFETKYNPRSKDWDKIESDEKKGFELREWFYGVLDLWMGYMREYSAFYIWSAVFDEGWAIYNAIKDAGLHIQSQIVWGKNAFSLGQTDYHWQHEICWYAFVLGKKHRWFGERNQSTLWNVKKLANSAYLHPMQKPTDLYSVPMRNHTKAGEITVDPFEGCGSSIAAAEESGRICYAMEKDPKWVAVALDRFEQLGLSPELVNE